MSRYIDADEFGRCLQNYRPYVDSGRFNAIQTEVNQVLDCIEYEIEDTPSIDICFCKECKHRKPSSYVGSIKTYECDITGFRMHDLTNHFCSCGEREGE